MKKLLLFSLITHITVSAQIPSLLKDISSGSAHTTLGEFYTLPNNNVLFAATASTTLNTGAWFTDGSTAGTVLLRPLSGVTSFAAYSGKTYFGATKTGLALWRTDGTLAGTDSVPVVGLNSAKTLSVVNNLLVFAANYSLTGPNTNYAEIWRSDGTSAGTYSLTPQLNNVKTFSVINNVLYFSASTNANGNELWRSDGTTAGTYMLKDIWTGTGSSFTNNPIVGVVSNTVFLIANDGATGAELWKTDGSNAGTSLVKDIYSGTASSNISSVTIGPNGAYFMANNQINGNELWFSDGTTVNTQLIRDVKTGTASAQPSQITFAGNYAYYYYNLYLNSISYCAIYKSDGSSAGTTTLNANSYTTTNNSIIQNIYDTRLNLYNNELYFVTHRHDLQNSIMDIDTFSFTKVDLNLGNKTIVHKMKHDVIQGGVFMTYLYSYNTIIGSHFIYSLKTSGGSGLFSLLIFNPVTNQHKIYYNLAPSNLSPYPIQLAQSGNNLFFPFPKQDCAPAYINLNNDSLYTLKNVNLSGDDFLCTGPGASPGIWYHKQYQLNNKTYFMAYEPAYGVEFFETNYTNTGTLRVLDIYPGANSFDNNNNQNNCLAGKYVIHQTPANIFFGADDGANGFELWTFVNSPANPPNTSGVVEIKSGAGNIRLYPNPVTQKLNLQSDVEIMSIHIYNALGAEVQNINPATLKNSAEINIEELSNGVYFVTVKTSAGTVSKRFLKTN